MNLNRRQLLAAALAALRPAGAAGALERSRISVITDEIAHSPEDAISFARQYGLSLVELRDVPGQKRHYDALNAQELEAAARQFRDAGLKISFFNSGLLKHMLPGTEPANPRHRQENAQQRFDSRMEALRRSIRAAQILGVDQVRVFAFFRVREPLALLPRIAEILAEMAGAAEREGVRLLVENEGSCNVATCAELAALLRLLPSRAIGINWDPHNGIRFKEQPLEVGYPMLPKDRIGNVQIKGKSVLPEWSQLLDWRAIFETMTRDGYRGAFGLETHIFGEGQIAASHASMREILRIAHS